MFKLFYENRKKGFSVVELIIAVTIASIVLGAFGVAFYVIQNSYNSSMLRGRITNAVQLASQKFETNTNLIANAKQLDVFYDSVVDGGIIFDKEAGTFTWRGRVESVNATTGEKNINSAVNTPYVLPEENYANTEKYSYIFSTEAWDTEGNYLGYYVFARNIFDSNSAGETYVEARTNSMLFLENEGAGEIPVKLELGIASTYLPDDSTDLENAVEVDVGQVYSENCIKVTFKSGKEEVTKMQTSTVYALENFDGRSVNFRSGKLYMEKSWVQDDGVAWAYPCGWNNEFIGTSTRRGYPSSKLTEAVEVDESGKITSTKDVSLTDSQLKKAGNVLRFLSPLSDNSVEDTIAQGSQLDKGSCPIEDYFLTVDTAISKPIITELKSFRDNTLKGNVIGDWVIDFYYNSFKPFYFKNESVMEPIMAMAMDPIVDIYCSLKE